MFFNLAYYVQSFMAGTWSFVKNAKISDYPLSFCAVPIKIGDD